MGKKRIIKAHTDKAGQSVGVENLVINNDLTVNGGIVGKTDGVAVPAGYVGEVLTFSGSGTPGAGTNANVGTFGLDAGIWLINVDGRLDHNSSVSRCWMFLSTVGGTSEGDFGDPEDSKREGPANTAGGGEYKKYMQISTRPRNLSSTTTFYVNSRTDGAGGQTMTWKAWAVRIA